MAADGPLTPMEYAYWLRRLGRTKREQAAMLRELLRNANTDRMTPDDREICVRALDEVTRRC